MFGSYAAQNLQTETNNNSTILIHSSWGALMCQGLYLARLTGVTCLCSWVDMQMKCGGSQGQLVTVSNDLQLALLFALMIS